MTWASSDSQIIAAEDNIFRTKRKYDEDGTDSVTVEEKQRLLEILAPSATEEKQKMKKINKEDLEKL